MIEVTTKESKSPAKLLIVGVGGAGNNAINRMIDEDIQGVEYIGINTDEQVLRGCKADKTISIGTKLTEGKGAGGLPEVGAQAAEESADEIAAAFEGFDMVFITAGMGGGTGTGAAPVVARIAKEMGILTVAIVSKPFPFEQRVRMERALAGIDALKDNVDTLVVIPNEKLLQICDKKISFKDALLKADEVLQQSVQGITDCINDLAVFNLDFADVCSVMRNKGVAHIGIGMGRGDDKAIEAARLAVQNPLLETSIDDCTDILLNITGDIALMDAQIASEYIESITGDKVDVKLGVCPDESMQDCCVITLIATGIEMPVPTVGRVTITSPDRYKPNAPANNPKVPTVPAYKPEPAAQPQVQPVAQSQEPLPHLDFVDSPAPAPKKTTSVGQSGIGFAPRPRAKKEFVMPDFMKKNDSKKD